MMETVRMKVEGVKLHAIDTNKPRYGIGNGGIWYNGFGSAPCEEGDVIDLTYETVNKMGTLYFNVKSVKVVGSQKVEESAQPKKTFNPEMPTHKEPIRTFDGRNLAINRAVALKGSIDIVACSDFTAETRTEHVNFVIAVSRQLEQYLNE